MIKKWICFLLSFSILMACSGPVLSEEPQNKPWIGEWVITWQLSQRSELDTVVFTEEDGILSGTTKWGSGFIIGWVSEQLFQGTWAREPSFLYPDHGDIQLTINSNGTKFSGKWRIGTEEDQADGKEMGNWMTIQGDKKGTGDDTIQPPPAKPKKNYIVIVLQINNPFMRVDEKVVEIDPGRDTTPIILKGSTLCPIRAVVEALGGTIAWLASEQKITIQLKNLKLELWINQKTAKVNGKTKTLSVPPQIIKGRTMVPVRFVSEELGCQVFWDPQYQLVTIEYSLTEKKPGEEEPPEESPKCSITFTILNSTRLSTSDEEDRTKKERWKFDLEAKTQNAPEDVILAYEWKYGNTSWSEKYKVPTITIQLEFPVMTNPFEQPEQPVAVRVWDWTNGNILASFSGFVARPIKVK